MIDYNFKIGDRVRVVKIDDEGYRGAALYQVGDVGRIISQGPSYHGNYALIAFDRLKESDSDYTWAALENWLVEEKQVIIWE